MSVFKSRHPFASRRAEFERISQRFPGRIPIIVEKASRSVDAPPLQKQKFLAPEAMTIGQFIEGMSTKLGLYMYLTEQAFQIFFQLFAGYLNRVNNTRALNGNYIFKRSVLRIQIKINQIRIRLKDLLTRIRILHKPLKILKTFSFEK